jgi:nucleotide-binding universal stress UspA family protein
VNDAVGEVRTFVVPIDGSQLSKTAVPVADSLARELSAEVCLFSAVPTEDDVAERERDLAGIQVVGRVQRLVVVNLDPAGAIHEAVRRLPAAVACMATHGRGRSAALVGSVATEVMARGHDPLILVGRFIGDYAPWIVEPRPSGVVAAVDDNPAVDTTLSSGVRWAKLLRDRLVIVSIAEPVPPALASGEVHRRFGPDGDVDLFLSVLATKARKQHDDVETRALYDPISVAEGLRTFLREHPAKLVVTSSHARTALQRAVFGSVAADIVRSSPSPVLVVPVGTVRRPQRRRRWRLARRRPVAR